MAVEPLMLNVPKPLYNRIKLRANESHRSVEDEALELLATAVSDSEEGLSAELATSLSALEKLNEQGLWHAARSKLSAEDIARIEALHEKRQGSYLTEDETRELEALIHSYELNMVLRAHAARLLRERGHDVSILVAAP